MEIICGIYSITNTVTRKIYIGSSVNCLRRWKEHRKALNNNNHVNSYLQRAWNKDGKDNFLFEIMEICSRECLKNREADWIDFYGGINTDATYNLMDARRNCPNEEVRQKISVSKKGRKLSEETRQKISEYNKAHPNRSCIGRVPTKEERNKISQRLKGHTPWNKGLTKEDPRVLNNVRKLVEVGSNPSQETRNKISNTVKRLHAEGRYDYAEITRKRLSTTQENIQNGKKRKVRKDKGIKKNPDIGRHISEGKRKANERKRALGLPLRRKEK